MFTKLCQAKHFWSDRAKMRRIHPNWIELPSGFTNLPYLPSYIEIPDLNQPLDPLVKSGVLEPNIRVKTHNLAFTPKLTTGGGCHSNEKPVNHPETSMILYIMMLVIALQPPLCGNIHIFSFGPLPNASFYSER